MRYLKLAMPILFAAAVAAGCGDKEEVSNPPKNAPVEEEQASENPTYIFSQFDVEADYENTMDAVDISYENEKNGTEASYENKEKDIRLTGDEAMKELDKKFKAFKFDQNSSDEDVMKEVKEAFGIKDEAKVVEIDITFADGTEKEYRQQ